MNKANTDWYILYTMPRMEKKLALMLSTKHIENYLPLLKQKKKWSDRFKITETPAFPSYLFVRGDINVFKKEILSLPGAHHFLTQENEYQTIDQDSIEMVKKMIEEFPDSVRIRKEKLLVPGNKVKIKYGYFKNHTGIIMRVKGKSRLCVRLPVGDISVEVNIDELGLEELNV